MADFKVKKVKNYTPMSNEHLQNKELSLKAKDYYHICCLYLMIGTIH